MPKYYCQYCDFRTVRKFRLANHIKENHKNIDLNDNKGLIKVALITSYASIENMQNVSTTVWQSGLNNYQDKIIFVNSLEEATHAVITNIEMPNLKLPKNNVIGIAWEPNEFLNISDKFLEYAKNNLKYYFIGDILPNYPSNFREMYSFMLNSNQRDNYFKKNIKKKTKNMSLIFSDKKILDGHKYRHKLVDEILKTNLDIDIFGFGCKKLKKKDKRLKGVFKSRIETFNDYKYTITIENTIHKDYISEKFVNPIAYNTIPIYYGSPNIEKYFGNQKCYYRLTGKLKDDMIMIKKICNNIDDHLLDLSQARFNLFEGKAYMMKFLYEIFTHRVSCELMGGLGNQLFQIFTTISYALEHNKTFVFTNNKELKIGPTIRKTYWDNLLNEIKDYTESDINISKVHYEQGHTYNKIPNYDGSVKMYGYFQSFKYFEENLSKILKIINLDNKKKNIRDKYFNYNGLTISLHFRIGDYAKLGGYHPILKLDYYINCLNYLISKLNCDNFIILYFCEEKDDNIVKNHINQLLKKFKNLDFKKVSNNLDDWEQLLMMSLCDHNIIANSSFSWWGSYLNENENKIVCCPNKWFGEKLKNKDTKDLFYKNCKIIEGSI